MRIVLTGQGRMRRVEEVCDRGELVMFLCLQIVVRWVEKRDIEEFGRRVIWCLNDRVVVFLWSDQEVQETGAKAVTYVRAMKIL